MTGAEAVLGAAVLLLSLACVVLGVIVARRHPNRWWLDATLLRDEQHHNSGQHTRHYQLTVELKPGQESR